MSVAFQVSAHYGSITGKRAFISLENDVQWTSKSVVAQKKLFLNAAYLLREMAISLENCGSLRRLLSSGSVVK